MKIPKTTKKKPYIEFRFNKKGDMKLKTTSDWWGGINDGFYCTNGTCGNTCLPENLNRYIESFKKRKSREIEKEIRLMQNELQKIQNYKTIV
jgi:hypothetical protein